MPRFGWAPAFLVSVAAFAAVPLHAQHTGSTSLGISAVPMWERVDPVPGGGALDEFRILKPIMMLHAEPLAARLRIDVMLNLEGLTLADGQLAPGNWGEGFVDRRHPHTWLHEVMVTAPDLLGSAGGTGPVVSVAAGKGFAPFGTDDPMTRPAVRYPLNHHLAQVLERVVAIVAMRAGPLIVETALFNGDEPESPEQLPNLRRFGDSWAARVTAVPAAGIEVQGSYAHVASPEHRPGEGLDQTKWSASARLERHLGTAPVYAMVEWARSDEADGFFVFESLLGEAAWSPGPHRVYYRLERTERPEELRTLDPFRTVRPHTDNSILATTRWTVHTTGYEVDLMPADGQLRIAPVVEASFGRVRSETPVSFDPEQFYGKDTFWSLSIGVRLGWGARLHRMGRYGVARIDPASSEPGHPGHTQ